jgi:hypothetical protein
MLVHIPDIKIGLPELEVASVRVIILRLLAKHVDAPLLPIE